MKFFFVLYLQFIYLTLLVSASAFAETFQGNPKQYSNIKPITLVFESKPNPPYYFGEGSSINWDKPGLSIDLFNIAADNLGIEFNYIRRPWARAIQEVKANNVQGIFNASFKKSRLEIGVYPMKDGNVDPSRKVMTQAYTFYKTSHSPIKWDGSTLTGLKGSIGTIISYSINNDLQAQGYKVDPVATQRINLNKLASGRIELIADIDTMNDPFMKPGAEFHKKIIKLTPPIKEKAYYLVFSHAFAESNPELVQDIWDELVRIKQSDIYQLLLDKYL